MSNIVAQPGELKMTVQVTRKETGKVEEYTLINTDEAVIPTYEVIEGEPECPQQ